MTESRSALERLECSVCHREERADALRNLCRCGGVLLARYRLDEAARTMTADALRTRGPSQWRYAELLPGSEAPVTLGEGMTPLHRARLVERSLGLERVFIKDESLNPTGSFKARGMSAAITMAVRLGVRRIALPSQGNAGGAAAAYGALAGVPVDVFFPADTPEPFRLEAAALGATVHRVEGDLSACGARVRDEAAREGWFDLSTLREPYRVEGKKTMGFEIAEQLGWELPDVIVYPAGGGTGLVGIWKAVEEMERLGLVRPDSRPRMVAVQSAGCAPIVKAFREGKARAARWERPRTYALGLAVPAPIGDALMIEVLRESSGTAVAVSDDEIAAGQLDLSRGAGIFACPEGGATLAAARRLVADGWIGRRDSVVLFNTGTGLKYPRVPGLKVP